MTETDELDLFLAFSSKNTDRSNVLHETARRLHRQGIKARSWRDLPVPGRLIVDVVTESIDSCKGLVADVSDMNSNVLYEVGYALAKGKYVWLCFDESDPGANQHWKENPMFATLGRINYDHTVETLTSRIVEAFFGRGDEPLLGSLLVDAKGREANAVFAPHSPHASNATKILERNLERKGYLKVLASGDDLGLAPLKFYASEIYRSSAAIFHLVLPAVPKSSEHNARSSFLAGYSVGWGIPTILVAEDGFESPLDYKDRLFCYSNASQLAERVDKWLESLPKIDNDRRRLGRLALDVEMPIRSFGQYVAENESGELSSYYIETNEFEAILNGRASVFVGRKGTGKTATMLQSVEELRGDRRNLVVPIKPSSYELESLLELLSRVEKGGNSSYFLLQLWTLLIGIEVGLRALTYARESAAGSGGSQALTDLEEILSELGVDFESDFTSRLDAIVEDFVKKGLGERAAEAPPSLENVKFRLLPRLIDSVKLVVHQYKRVAVFVDNLDKAWESDVDFELVSRFLLSLLTASGRLRSEFEKASKGSPGVNLTLAVFLRADIYDVMSSYAREPDKINPQLVRWDDRELLIRVLEERYVANRERGMSSQPDMWNELFCSEVRGLPTRDYFLWRVLPRPRDIIYLGNVSITTAINRKHQIVEADDVKFAEKLYSQFAVDALLVESEAQGFDLEELLYDFAGLDSTLAAAYLDERLGNAGSGSEIRDWLVRSSFLGLEIADGDFVHVEGRSEARRKLIIADRFARTVGKNMRYRVHPAFRCYLEIRDDDLHVDDLRDITLG